MKKIEPARINTRGGWKTPAVSKSFILIREQGSIRAGTLNVYTPGPIRILNAKTGTLHPGVFATLSEATRVLIDLTHWENINRSKPGRARTKRGNDALLKRYRASK